MPQSSATKDAWQQQLEVAALHLARYDPVLMPVIKQYGLCRIAPHSNYYQALVDAIISQQLSVKAAASIEQRFQALFSGHFPSPAEILTKDTATLRAAGLSGAKTTYIHDLAQHLQNGTLLADQLPALSNEKVVHELTAVKGIGEWTAHMFLMFSLGRLDVLPVGDLGLKNGIRKLYALPELPSAAEIQAIATQHHWRPYESIASWYIWQSLNNTPAI